MHENYTVQGEKFMGIDKRTMNIIHRILYDAVDYHNRNRQDLIDDIVNQGAHRLRCSNPECKEEVEEDWENCAFCSSPIPNQNTPAPPAIQFCSICNNEVEDNWDICPCCEGYLKRPATCCNIPVRPNFAFCPKCKKIFPK